MKGINQKIISLVCIVNLFFVVPTVSAKIDIQVQYHSPTNLFTLMDGVSAWRFNDRAYRRYWKERFGWSREDARITRLYRQYRNRNYFDRGQNNPRLRAEQDGVFAMRSSFSLTTDPLAGHFMNAPSIESALASLEKVATKKDAENLRVFYLHFKPKWQKLLQESAVFQQTAYDLQEQIEEAEVVQYLARLSGFYQVKQEIPLRARLVWWPPINRTLADISGRTLLLRRNPKHHAEDKGWLEVIMHEAVHYISAHLPVETKRALSEVFLQQCPIKIKGSYDYFEEPMAIAWGQAAFAKYALAKPLSLQESWYHHPIRDLLGRLMWMQVDEIYATDTVLDEEFVKTAAHNCALFLNAVSTKRTWWK